MKPPHKQDFPQIAFNYSSDIDCKDFVNLLKKCIAKPYSFIVIDTTAAWDNILCSRKYILQRL